MGCGRQRENRVEEKQEKETTGEITYASKGELNLRQVNFVRNIEILVHRRRRRGMVRSFRGGGWWQRRS